MSEPASTSESADESQLNLVWFSLLAVVLGIVTGLGAIAFRYLIAFFHNLFFYAEVSFHYESEQLFAPSVWGNWVVLVPIVGGMGVVWLTRTFAPETRGHGVPEVMDAVYHREGHIRPVVAAAKSLASALSIGSGASVGREGPIIQIGASIGSSLGGLLHLATWQRITLVAAGAGAGIAATFNTPLGGVMFALEIMLPEVSSRTFLPVVLSTATATYIGRLAFGMVPAFLVPSPDVLEVHLIDSYAVLAMSGVGILCGLGAFVFIRMLSWMEHAFESMPFNAYIQHALGMLFVGGLILALQTFFGHYYVAGASYGTITQILNNELAVLHLLLILFLAKLAATTISLGSGASGGIFSPSLFLGATLGGAFGVALMNVWPAADVNPMNYAIVGMASMVGGATGAAMTAIVMVFEMTRDYVIIVPLVMAVALAIGVRRWLSVENIYTIKLAWRGKQIPQERHLNMFLVRHAEEFMEDRVAVLPAAMSLDAALEQLGYETDVHYIIAVDDAEAVQRVVPISEILRAGHGVTQDFRLDEVNDHGFVTATASEILNDVVKRLTAAEAAYALILDDAAETTRGLHILGVLDKDHLGDSVMTHFRTVSGS